MCSMMGLLIHKRHRTVKEHTSELHIDIINCALSETAVRFFQDVPFRLRKFYKETQEEEKASTQKDEDNAENKKQNKNSEDHYDYDVKYEKKTRRKWTEVDKENKNKAY